MDMKLYSYLPHPARIEKVRRESDDTRTFVLRPDPPVPAFDNARPGQFAMLSVFGHGEAAFTFSSLPCAGGPRGLVTLTVRRVGSLTSAIFALSQGARVGVRGPFGRGLPLDAPVRPTLYVAGGCGLSPIKAAIEHHIARRQSKSLLAVLYGARDPETRIHRESLETWRLTPGVDVLECVDNGNSGWKGLTGLVPDFVEQAVTRSGIRSAVICGPQVMFPPVITRLRRTGLQPSEIFLVLERYMKCGTRHCGHCYIDNRYVCDDGPVFQLAELLPLRDALPELGKQTGAMIC